MLKVSREIIINSAVNEVWNTLINFERFPEWNPFLLKIKGELNKGSRLRITVQPVGGKKTVTNTTLRKIVPGHIIQWSSGNPIFFAAQHTITIKPIGENKTLLIQTEHFKGIFPFMFSNRIIMSAQDSFEGMNRALKQYVEARTSEVVI